METRLTGDDSVARPLSPSADPSPPAPPRPPARTAVFALLALVTVAAISSFGLPTRLVWDDYLLVGGLDSIVDARSLIEPFRSDFFDRAPDNADRHYYRPLVQVSYLLGVALFGKEPFFFGLANLLFHLVVCGLLFALLRRWGVAPPAAALGTALFGLMPRLTESVFWISGRTDVLASVFVMAALLCWDDRAERHGRRTLAGALLFLGLLCKEVALAGAAALMLREAGRALAPGLGARARLRTFAIRIAPLLALVAGYAALRLAVLPAALRTSLSLGLGARLALAAEALGRYAVMLVDAVHPALRIGHVVAPREPLLLGLGLVVAGASFALVTWCLRRQPDGPELVGLGLAGAALAPTLHLLPFGSDAVAADRFLYLPVAGLVLACAAAAGRLPRMPRRVLAGSATALLVVFAAACLERARQWSDDVILWHHTLVHADPIDSIPHAWLGLALHDRHQPGAALAHFKEAIRIEMSKAPEQRKGTLILDQLANVSAALSAMGRDAEALQAIEQAVHHRPDHVAYHEQRARVLGRLLRFEAARAALATARDLGGHTAGLAAWSAQLAAIEREWRALPGPTADEPTAVLAQRARLLARLGADPAAAALWRSVLARPDVRAEWIAAAAAFHTVRAHPAEAAVLIDRLEQTSEAHREDARVLREALQARAPAPVPDRILSAAADLEARS